MSLHSVVFNRARDQFLIRVYLINGTMAFLVEPSTTRQLAIRRGLEQLRICVTIAA
jgi:hypothetical protein